MRIAFVMHGSRGDVQPAVALGAELSRRGHSVEFAVPDDLVAAVSRSGLPTRSLCPSTSELLSSPLVKRDLKSWNPYKRLTALRKVGSHGSAMSERVMGELADTADVLVGGPLAQERAATVAESRRIAFVPLHYCPIRPNHQLSPLYRPLPTAISAAVWRTADFLFSLTQRPNDRALRRRLGLPSVSGTIGARLRRRGSPEIQAYDAELFPLLEDEWGKQRPFTGFLLPDSQTRAKLNGHNDNSQTTGILDWIRSGPSPVYVGFGSMHIPPERISSIVDAILSLRLRVIAHTPHALPERDGLLHITDPVDHEILFPACRAAVHHGGAGTTAAALRAGIPSVIGWLSADQPLWAAALRDRGAGTGAPLSRLADTDLELLTASEPYRAAQALASRIVDPEEAVDAACDVILQAAAAGPTLYAGVPPDGSRYAGVPPDGSSRRHAPTTPRT